MIKKYALLAIGALLCAGTAAAYVPGTPTLSKDILTGEKGQYTAREAALIEKALKVMDENPGLSTRAYNPSLITDIIYEPEGTPKYFYKDVKGCESMSDTMVGWIPYQESNNAVTVVFGDNNDVYFKDFLSFYNYGSYLKGTMDASGEITVTFPQTVSYYADYGFFVNLCLYKKSGTDYVFADENTATFSYKAATGNIRLTLPGNEGDYMIGLTLAIGPGTFLGDGDYYQNYKAATNVTVNSLPEGLVESPYLFREGNYGYTVYVSQDNENIYLRGLSETFPQGVVVAKKESATSASISQNQIIGTAYGFWTYTKYMEQLSNGGWQQLELTNNYPLTIDASASTITGNVPGRAFCLMAYGSLGVFWYELFKDFTVYQQQDVAGVPADPFDLYFDQDVILFGFNLPNLSTTDGLLNTNNLYYRIFVNDEVWEFESDLTGEIMTEIPFSYSGTGIFYYDYSMRFVMLDDIEGVETMGVQSVYRNNGVVTESNVVTINRQTQEVTTKPGTGVESLFNSPVVSEVYYDLAGRKVNNLGKGVYIKRSTLENGKVVSSKIIK